MIGHAFWVKCQPSSFLCVEEVIIAFHFNNEFFNILGGKILTKNKDNKAM